MASCEWLVGRNGQAYFETDPDQPAPSLRANGSRECAPDDRLREAIHNATCRGMDCFVASLLAMTKNGGIAASVSIRCSIFAIRRSPQPSRRMGEQGVDEARFRSQVAAQGLRSAILAGDFIEQPLEFRDVAVDGLLEAAVGAVFAGDLVEGLLA